MRALIVWTLSLVSLTGCLQSTTPVQSTKVISVAAPTAASVTVASQPKLRLSVQMNPHQATAGGIIAVTLVFSASGSEPVVLEPAGELSFLDLAQVDGDRMLELPFGVIGTIRPGQPRIIQIELPVYRVGTGEEVIPYEPGRYQLTLAMRDRPEKSSPCIFQVFEPRDSSEPVSTP